MFILPIINEWDQQPPLGSGIDFSHPLARKLEFFHCGNSMRDLVANAYRLTPGSGFTITTDGQMGGLVYSGTGATGGDAILAKGISVSSGEDVTFGVRFKLGNDTTGGLMCLRGTTPRMSISVGYNGGAISENRLMYLARDDDGSVVFTSTEGILVNDGAVHTTFFRRVSGQWAFASDGSDWTALSSGASGAITISSNPGMAYLNDPLNSAIGNLIASISFGAFWRRGLSRAESMAMHKNPSQIIAS